MKHQKTHRKYSHKKIFYRIFVFLLIESLSILPPINAFYEQLSAYAYEGIGVLPELLDLLKTENTEEANPLEIVEGSNPSEITEGSANTSDNDWMLLLVNRTHPIPEDYEITLTQLQNNQAVDSRIYPDLQAMFDDARSQGILPMISSSYRTSEKQQQLMDEKIAEYKANGNDEATAIELAEKWVAIPGTSEHQTGICVDITTADESVQDAGVVWDWLLRNSYQYGFIKRYPEDKTDITGIINEPWHYRYVGKEAAREIWERGICLEEYLGED